MVKNDNVEPNEPSQPKNRVEADQDQTAQAEPLCLLHVDAGGEGTVAQNAEQVHVEAHLDAVLEVQSDIRG